MSEPTPISPEIEVVWRRGDKVVAIKLLRDATGWGLAETKQALEAAFDQDHARPAADMDADLDDDLPAAIHAALASGNKIVAVKLLKEAAGIGLKEAKDRIESGDPSQWQANASAPTAHYRLADTVTYASVAPPAWTEPGHEPGKVPPSQAWKAVLAILLIAIIAGWFFWRG